MSNKIDDTAIDPVVESTGDKIHRTIRASLSAIPMGGGAAVEVFNSLITPPIEKRRTEWMIQVTNALNELFDKTGITFDALQEDEQFFTSLVQASAIAVKNHQKVKLEALRNAVVNSATPDRPDESLQQIFLNMIDSFTVWHILILKLFYSPLEWAKENSHSFSQISMGGLSSIIESAYPELRDKKGLYELIWRDLNGAGLLNTEGLHVIMSCHGLVEKRTNDTGDLFIKFITEANI